jgi:hypothetical protein
MPPVSVKISPIDREDERVVKNADKNQFWQDQLDADSRKQGALLAFVDQGKAVATMLPAAGSRSRLWSTWSLSSPGFEAPIVVSARAEADEGQNLATDASSLFSGDEGRAGAQELVDDYFASEGEGRAASASMAVGLMVGWSLRPRRASEPIDGVAR